MLIKFYKYQATGNDFVMIDDRDNIYNLSVDDVKFLCDRRYGIGADGLILLKSSDKLYDFKMAYYNADGNESTMCGNGGRSIVMFAKDLGLINKSAKFLAIDGEHTAEINNEIVELKMTKPEFKLRSLEDYFVDTGSPHFIEFTKNVKDCDVFRRGTELRHSDDFKQIGGTNVDFVEKISEDEIYVRTFERGVEDETLSCGTGVVASAIIMHKNRKVLNNHIKINTLGGKLSVRFDDTYSNVYLSGPAKRVFSGEIII